MNFFKSLFQKEQINLGLLPSIDPLGARHDLIFGATEPQTFPDSVSHLKDFPTRHFQGAKPYCTAYAAVHQREYFAQVDKNYLPLSPDALARFARNGPTGNTVQAPLDIARKMGIPLQSDYPGDSDNFDPSGAPYPPPALSSEALTRAAGYKFKDYAFLSITDVNGLKKALQKGIGGLSFGLDSGFADRQEGKPIYIKGTPTNYHEVTISGYTPNGIEVYCSLRVPTYLVPWDYPYITSVDIPVDLPPNWKDIQDQAVVNLAPNNATYYGQKRNLAKEKEVATALQTAFLNFHNKSVYEAAGRFWNIYVRAIVYGNYSIMDTINDCYNWRRTNQHIFDFDKLR